MANWELQLVRKIAEEGQTNPSALSEALELGVKVQIFRTAEGQVSFEFMLQYASAHEHFGEIASLEMLKEEFPTFEFPAPRQSIPALSLQVLKGTKGAKMASLFEDIGDYLFDDPDAAMASILEGLADISSLTGGGKDIDVGQTFMDVIRKYDSIANNEGTVGLPWPHAQLTTKIGGIEEEDLIVLFGKPKSGKTWGMIQMISHLFWSCNARILVVSGEMAHIRLMSRAAVTLAGLDYNEFRKGKLGESDRFLLEDMIQAIQDESIEPTTRRYVKFLKNMGSGEEFLLQLQQKVETYKPDIVFVDAVYLFADDMDWRKIHKFSHGLKRIAQHTKCPLVVLTQENEKATFHYKGGRGSETIAHSGAWIEIADKAIKYVLKKHQETGLWYQSWCSIVDREDEGACGIRTRFHPAKNFEFAGYDYDKSDIEDPAEQQNGNQGGGNGREPKIRKLVEDMDMGDGD
jgi:archaellum biogenesis ATPase FlaH